MKSKKVLLTGAGGFIGSHLCEALVREGYNVRAFIKYNSQNLWGWLDRSSVKKDIEVMAGDIRDFDSVNRAIGKSDIVINLAALISIPYSYQNQQAYIDVNIKGTMNILQAALERNVKKVIHTSTSEIYGTARYVPIDEKHPRQPQSPYSATKIGADCIAESFYRSFDLPVVIARPFNTYGPRQSARAIVPTIITQLLSGSNEIKIGDCHPKRDFIYIMDTVKAFIAIVKSDKVIGEDMNIATQCDISIGDLAKKIIRMINPKAKAITDEVRLRPKKSEVERLLGDNKKIKRLTGWKPGYALDEGLKETIDWFRDKGNMALYKPEIYNV